MKILLFFIRRSVLALSDDVLHNVNERGFSPMTVLSDYAPLVKSRALLFLCDGSELDDLIQEGNIGLLSATKKYDSSLSAFSTFARKCIDASIIDYLRKNQKISRVPSKLLVDINDIEIPDVSCDLEHLVSVKEEYGKIINKAKEVLSSFEHSVFNGLLRGDSHAEIAERESVEIKAIRNAVQRIRAKLK